MQLLNPIQIYFLPLFFYVEINLCTFRIFHNSSLIALTKSFIVADFPPGRCELSAARFHPPCLFESTCFFFFHTVQEKHAIVHPLILMRSRFSYITLRGFCRFYRWKKCVTIALTKFPGKQFGAGQTNFTSNNYEVAFM